MFRKFSFPRHHVSSPQDGTEESSLCIGVVMAQNPFCERYSAAFEILNVVI